MIPQALEIQQAILQKEMNSVEDNLNVLRREGKGISRGMLKGLEKRKYPSLEQEHLFRMPPPSERVEEKAYKY